MDLPKPPQATAQILVIERHPAIRDGLCAPLDAWTPNRVVVSVAYDDQSVEQCLTAQCPDLVLLDMELPLAHGSHLLQLIKRRAPHARVIAWMMYPTSQTAAIGVGVPAYRVRMFVFNGKHDIEEGYHGRSNASHREWFDLVPVLLGAGIRYFDHLSPNPIELELIKLVEGTGVTHLRYRVVK